MCGRCSNYHLLSPAGPIVLHAKVCGRNTAPSQRTLGISARGSDAAQTPIQFRRLMARLKSCPSRGRMGFGFLPDWAVACCPKSRPDRISGPSCDNLLKTDAQLDFFKSRRMMECHAKCCETFRAALACNA